MSIFDKLFKNENDQELIQKLKYELDGIINILHESAIVSETDIQGNIIYANDTFCEISGYKREELIGQNHRILKSGLHENIVYENLWKTISIDKKIWRGVISNKRKDGTFYWVKAIVSPVLDNKGIPLKFVSVRYDITESIEKEEELEKIANELTISNNHLKRIQFELNSQFEALNNASIVSITDKRGEITYVNDTFCKISKYTKNELLGENHRILKSGHQPQEIFEQMWKTISSGKVWHGIIKNKAKDDSYYWVHSTITPIIDERNNITKYIAIRFDISAEKELEELFKKSNSIENLNSSLLLEKDNLENKVEKIESSLTHSLKYAQKLQNSLLPDINKFKDSLCNFEFEYFHKPKESVSGDFYWVGNENENKSFLFFGESVPGVKGAFLSILGLDSVYKIVKEKGVFLPDLALQFINLDIFRKLNRSNDDEQDFIKGIAIIIEDKKIWFSAANYNPIIVTSLGYIKKFELNSLFLGHNENQTFTLNDIYLNSGDTFYVFSDGFQKQLGGENSSPFGVSNLYDLLVSLNTIADLKTRKELIIQKMSEWSGFFNEQDDDMSIIMFKLK